MMVKICGITRRQDAEAASAAGADALGFVFVSTSPRYVTPEQAAALGEGLAPWKVGIFVDQPASVVADVMRVAHLDVAQIYGGSAPDGVRVWNAVRVDQWGRFPTCPDSLEGRSGTCATSEALLLDGPSNGIQFDWRLVPKDSKIILAGGLTADNVEEAIRLAQPWGVDVSSGLESSPGVKDHQKVKRFVENARKAIL
jgi:phosphoribosylanthranilate isomerase